MAGSNLLACASSPFLFHSPAPHWSHQAAWGWASYVDQAGIRYTETTCLSTSRIRSCASPYVICDILHIQTQKSYIDCFFAYYLFLLSRIWFPKYRVKSLQTRRSVCSNYILATVNKCKKREKEEGRGRRGRIRNGGRGRGWKGVLTNMHTSKHGCGPTELLFQNRPWVGSSLLMWEPATHMSKVTLFHYQNISSWKINLS